VQPESPQVLQRGQGETILIVEDDQAILTFTSTLLADLGYKVRAANGPAEAVRLAHEQPHGIHLLLTDVVMPEMNGRDLAALLQTFYPGLKCLFMSGYADTLITDQEVVGQGLHFIQKPFTAGALAMSVRQALLQ
jgi:DNA-binding NtrC family response regulator